MFYPDPVKREVGFAITGMLKIAKKPHWKASRGISCGTTLQALGPSLCLSSLQ